MLPVTCGYARVSKADRDDTHNLDTSRSQGCYTRLL